MHNVILTRSRYFLNVAAVLFLFMIIISGCRSRSAGKSQEIVIPPEMKDTIPETSYDTVRKNKPVKKSVSIYGDTVWIDPFGYQEWLDTITQKEYSAFLSARVDTDDLIIDTVISKKGNRIVIGYNHSYTLKFQKGKMHWFTVSFDKKRDLMPILRETDFWMESNLDVFQNLVYNKKFDRFIIEYDINPGYNYGTIYYIVFTPDGNIQYIGTSGSWGGGGPDGQSFLTDNNEFYVTCHEIFNFTKMKPQRISDYTLYSDVLKEFGSEELSYGQIHAIRDLTNNTFLVVYDLLDDKPDYNALLMNTDSTILDRFRYSGLLEDVDALFLFYSDPEHSRYFVHDTERSVLVYIENSDSLSVKQISEANMKELPVDTLLSEAYMPVDFESYGLKIFFISDIDSTIYYREGAIE